jgi:hypothetical protein
VSVALEDQTPWGAVLKGGWEKFFPVGVGKLAGNVAPQMERYRAECEQYLAVFTKTVKVAGKERNLMEWVVGPYSNRFPYTDPFLDPFALLPYA